MNFFHFQKTWNDLNQRWKLEIFHQKNNQVFDKNDNIIVTRVRRSADHEDDVDVYEDFEAEGEADWL